MIHMLLLLIKLHGFNYVPILMCPKSCIGYRGACYDIVHVTCIVGMLYQILPILLL